MKRREFNRLALGAGVSPLLASRAFAQGPDIESCSCRSAAAKLQYRHQEYSTNLQSSQLAAKVCRGKAAVQYLLDVELSVGVQSRRDRVGQSLFDHHGGAPCGVAEL